MQLKVTMKLCNGGKNEAKCHLGSISEAVIHQFGNAKMPAYGQRYTGYIYFLKGLTSCSSGLCCFILDFGFGTDILC